MERFILIIFLMNVNFIYTDIEHCISQKDNTCSMCQSPYAVSFDGFNCILCNQDDKIIIFYLCYTKKENCKVYNHYEDICETCNNGYKREENGDCTLCSEGKVGHNNYCFNKNENWQEYRLFKEGEKCLKCNNQYKLNEDSTQCIKCNEGFYSNGKKFHNIKNCIIYNYNDIYIECKNG